MGDGRPLPAFDDDDPVATTPEKPAADNARGTTHLFGFTEAQIEAERQRTVASNARARRIAEDLDLADENLPAIVGELSELNEARYGLRRKALAESFNVTVATLDKIYTHTQQANGRPTKEEWAEGREILPTKDYGHAAVLAPHFVGRYRWAPHRGAWMRWTGKVWQLEEDEYAAKTASDTLRAEYGAQIGGEADKAALQRLLSLVRETCMYAKITGALSFLKGWEGVLTRAEEWDGDTRTLNCQAGTLMLRGGKDDNPT